MSSTVRSPDVVVIGAGVIGSAIAWAAARRGLSVHVIERGTPGAATTAAAGGMLSPLAEAGHASPFATLAATSLDLYPTFVERIRERTGIDVELRAAGKLHVAFDRAEADALDALVEAGAEFGVERLSGEGARALEPALSAAVCAAVRVRRDARVDNRRLGHAVWQAAEADGVAFHLGRTAVAVDLSESSAQRVLLDDNAAIETGAIVIAAGAWSAAIRGLPRTPPIIPVRGQMFAVDATAAARRGLVAHTIHAPGCYLIPRENGRLVVGATAERVDFEPGPTPDGIRQLMGAAKRLAPAIGGLPLIETWAGFRPGTPDDLPILGRDADVPTLYWATGHYRNGVLLAPATADAIAALLSGDEAPLIGPFSIARFIAR